MRRVFIVFLFLISISTAFAKPLIVSDIDDTLRLTHREGDLSEQALNVLNLDLLFRGMLPIIKFMDRSGADIFYVTAAVPPMQYLSLAFLEYNEFPQSYQFYSKSWDQDTYEYKVGVISYLIEKNSPESVVLIGDNGEKDVAAYQAIASKYPNVHVFIHKLYEGGSAAAIPAALHTYITGADLAVQLEVLGYLTPEETGLVITGIQNDLASGNSEILNLVVPSWAEITAHDIEMAFDTHISPANQQGLQAIKFSIFN